jgi:hypothetical protein
LSNWRIHYKAQAEQNEKCCLRHCRCDDSSHAWLETPQVQWDAIWWWIIGLNLCTVLLGCSCMAETELLTDYKNKCCLQIYQLTFSRMTDGGPLIWSNIRIHKSYYVEWPTCPEGCIRKYVNKSPLLVRQFVIHSSGRSEVPHVLTSREHQSIKD